MINGAQVWRRGFPFTTMGMPPTQGVYDASGKYTVFSGVPWGVLLSFYKYYHSNGYLFPFWLISVNY
jgi:hypothetical protein